MLTDAQTPFLGTPLVPFRHSAPVPAGLSRGLAGAGAGQRRAGREGHASAWCAQGPTLSDSPGRPLRHVEILCGANPGKICGTSTRSGENQWKIPDQSKENLWSKSGELREPLSCGNSTRTHLGKTFCYLLALPGNIHMCKYLMCFRARATANACFHLNELVTA